MPTLPLSGSIRAATLTAAALLCVIFTGCHNRDSTITEQVSWKCPRPDRLSKHPTMYKQDGTLTDDYKKAHAVRFYYSVAPDQSFDLFQPGLCEFLQANGRPAVPMTISITRSPSGHLLSYGMASVAGRELGSSEWTRSVPLPIADRDAVDPQFVGEDQDPTGLGEHFPQHRLRPNDLFKMSSAP